MGDGLYAGRPAAGGGVGGEFYGETGGEGWGVGMKRIGLAQANSIRLPFGDEEFQCAVTSPPYYGLRSYSTAKWIGGDAGCDHVADPTKTKLFGNPDFNENRPSREATKTKGYYFEGICGKCGAIKEDKQIGLEPTLAEYIAQMCAVFDEVWRVLRPTGTVWLNLGDSYNGSGGAGGDYNEGGLKEGQPRYPGRNDLNFKPKDLMGVPWAVATALRARGWYLRGGYVWVKKSWMPESVKGWRWERNADGELKLRKGSGRCTTSHEYIFHFSKEDEYFYDHYAVMEESTQHPSDWENGKPKRESRKRGYFSGKNTDPGKESFRKIVPTRNRRSCWMDISPSNYKGPHFAAFPPDLPEICIKAGTSEAGECPICGMPWARVVEKGFTSHDGEIDSKYDPNKKQDGAGRLALLRQAARERGFEYSNQEQQIGWLPTCEHDADPVPQKVLDPFSGTGTTAMVANQLGRIGIGVDLSHEYSMQAKERTGMNSWQQWTEGNKDMDEGNYDDLPMFQLTSE